MKIDIEKIKKLREETGAGVVDAKKALENSKGDYEKAKQDLLKQGKAKAQKKADRVAKDGLIHAYIHGIGKVGSLIHVACETDFVAKTDDFQKLCHEIAMQVCAGDYKNVSELLESEYMRDPTKKVSDIVNETVAKVGENIEIRNIAKFSVTD